MTAAAKSPVEHSELPWETRPDGWQPWPGAIQILSADGEIIAYTTSGAREKQNAAFIVKAVNSHADLVDLATNVGGFDDGLLQSADLNVLRNALREYRDQARQALALTTARTPAESKVG